MSSVTMMISRPGSCATTSFNSVVTLVAGVCCCETAGPNALAPSITISATAKWGVRPDVPMIASSVFFRSGGRGCRKGPVAPTRLFQLEPERVGLIGDLAASDGVNRRHHAAVAAEHAVGERNQAAIGRRRRRGAAKLARDHPFVATRVERAGRDIGA